jgi:D-alanyl-D-alanine carboxypeptidase
MRTEKTIVVASAVLVGVLAVGLALVLFLTNVTVGHFDGAHGSSAEGGGAPSLPWGSSESLGEDDGYIETGEAVSPFDDDLPAIAQLDSALRSAMQDAARDAIADGVTFVVTSGWRSAAYQQSLLDAAVREYGSEEAAGEFVLSPEESRHVTGNAVDIGYTDADSWLSQHGADYGLCQTYTNEMWHFELATSPGGECPEQLSNAGVG